MTTMTETAKTRTEEFTGQTPRHFELSALALATADELERRGTFKGSLVRRFSGVPIEDCPVCLLGGIAAVYVGNPAFDYDLDDPFFEHFTAEFHQFAETGKAGYWGLYDWFDNTIAADKAKAVETLRAFAAAPAGLNPSPQTAEEALAIIRAAVRERGPQFNYVKHFGVDERIIDKDGPRCRYVEEGDVPGCIVGVGMHLAGRDITGWNSVGGAYGVCAHLSLPDEVGEVLFAAQCAQDCGKTWGEALEEAEVKAACIIADRHSSLTKSDVVLA